jgi:hypothetical protein
MNSISRSIVFGSSTSVSVKQRLIFSACGAALIAPLQAGFLRSEGTHPSLRNDVRHGAAYAGSDSFKYTDSDNRGATSNPATVAITVTAAKTSSSGGSSDGSGSGGGAMSLFEFLVLAGLVVSRRRRAADRSIRNPSAPRYQVEFRFH